MQYKGALIVTGGCSGIGKAILDSLSVHFMGENVLNIDVNNEKHKIDVRNYNKILGAFDEVVVENEENYLFSNAGVAFFTNPLTGKPVDFINAPIEQLHSMVDINLKGQINVLHAFINTLIKKRAKGNIVVVSSISAFFSGGPNMAVYDATKAAISALAKRLVPYNKIIRINIIEPGSVRTNIGGWNTDLTPNQSGKVLVKEGQDSDFKRLGEEVTLENIVNAVEFLFFKEHGLNGAEIVIDKGLTLMGREGY